MSGKNAKKNREAEKASLAARVQGINHIERMPAPDLRSFVAGFLSARGYDFIPMLTEHDGKVLVDLYHDAGERGFFRLKRIAIDEERMQSPRTMFVSTVVYHELLQSTPQRTPSPMSEGQIRNIRDQLLGSMQDNLPLEEWLGIIGQLTEALSKFLRRKPYNVAAGILDGIQAMDEPDPKSDSEASPLAVAPDPS
jgi:hypothetical protein